jgi:hypothetical protein
MPATFWGLVGKPYISGQQRYLEPVPDPRAKLLYTSDAIPIYYEMSGTTMYLYPGCSAESTLKGSYWSKPTELVAITDTMPYNELFDDAIQEALIHIYTTGLNGGNDLMALTNYINKSVDEIAPYLDKQAVVQAEDSMGLDYLTHEDY